jgi:hypothetical protein
VGPRGERLACEVLQACGFPVNAHAKLSITPSLNS